MRTWVGLLCVVVLACGVGIAGIGCGNVAGVPHKDAAQPLDVPTSSGGTVGTGGVHGSGGITAAGGSGGVAPGGAGGWGGTGTGGSTTSGTGGRSTGGSAGTVTGAGGARTGGMVGSGGVGSGGVGGSGGSSATGGSVGSGGLVGTGGATLQPVDASAATDGAGQSAPRDGTKVRTVSLTAAQVFMQPSAPFLLQADLTRGADGLFDVSAKVLVSVSGCTGDACNQQVTMHLSREETTQVESWLAVIPGEACHDDPGPICDFGVHYAVGIDGPPQNQTCCKLNEWGQNGDVTGLHSYLQNLAIAQLNPLDGSPG
jgi:hypothetical protein